LFFFSKCNFNAGLWLVGINYVDPGGGNLQVKPQKLLRRFFVFYSKNVTSKQSFGYIFRIKNPKIIDFGVLLAEKEGFEPPDLLQSTVFKTAAFDRSAISPIKAFIF